MASEHLVRRLRFLLRWALFLLLFWIAIMLIFKALENSLVYPGTKASDGWIEPTDPDQHHIADVLPHVLDREIKDRVPQVGKNQRCVTEHCIGRR